MTFVRTLIALTLAAQLSACGIMTTTPKPPPPPTAQAQAQEIVRAQTAKLVKIGTVTAVVRGSPMDVEAEIQRKATAAGARYYVIIMNSETVVPGQWYSQALLYR
ncbi:biofilm peroxide resistance protein BsmA [Serratia marcescens]|uniref:biofilm peroxide resistance protein BsmA n=1 Tax=Serratia marcescens TaxID=615 RepID=UPI000B5E1241|nr:biofilm peroxide resistance protein BsmA [Serratia marcescens]ASM19460.1 bioflm peroxide resistance protein BsmA [Serratia marcescens]